MEDNDREMFNELFTRLRETESETRAQGERIDSLRGSIDLQKQVIDKFLEHIARQETRSEDREKNFWKVITVLIGTIIAIVLGPKVATEIMQQWATGGTTKHAIAAIDVWANIDRRTIYGLPMKDDEHSLWHFVG